MSIKDLFDGIGNAFSVFWEGVKDLFYQIYTSEYGIWIFVGSSTELQRLLKQHDEYQVSKIMKKKPKWMEDEEELEDEK